MKLELRRKILADADSWTTAFMISKRYDLTVQIVNCVLLFRDMDDSQFVCIDDWDIHHFTIVDIANKTEFDHATIKRLLRSYTATEIIQDKEIIKVYKNFGDICTWGSSMI